MAARLRLVFDGGAGTLGGQLRQALLVYQGEALGRARLGTRRTAGTVHAQVAKLLVCEPTRTSPIKTGTCVVATLTAPKGQAMTQLLQPMQLSSLTPMRWFFGSKNKAPVGQALAHGASSQW